MRVADLVLGFGVAGLLLACGPNDGAHAAHDAGAGTGATGGVGGIGGVGGAGIGGVGGAGSSGVGGTLGLDASLVDASVDDASENDASITDASTPSTYATRSLNGPSYMGSVNNGAACSQSYATQGHEPIDPAPTRHPLFFYFVGTAFVTTDASAMHDNAAAMAVTEAMARRGYVALSVAYDNGALAWLSDHVNQLACLFGAGNAQSLIARACALPNVDCALGIATWGHSQGGYVAHMAHNNEPRVTAAWTTGYGGDGNATLSDNKLRVVNGENDTSNGQASTLNMITGLTPSECPNADQCLRPDGSGWIIVRQSQLADPVGGSADHCWFDRPSCGASAIMLEPHWVNRDSTFAFALELNADWLALAARAN
jgi:hypothetical protein